MKTIVFEDVEYEVEDWVRFAARDSDGGIYTYENKPRQANGEFEARTGKIAMIYDTTNDWSESLVRYGEICYGIHD